VQKNSACLEKYSFHCFTFLENYLSLKLRKSGSVYCQGCSHSGRKFFFVIENQSGPPLGLFCSLKPADLFLKVKLPDRESDHRPHHSTEVLECTELYLQLPMHIRGLVLWQRGITVSSRAWATRRRAVENIVAKRFTHARVSSLFIPYPANVENKVSS